ncbi:serine hydrolase domain-containing protein [Embleya hyalina]|uniref:Beta-lactamase n=1 Tax=Embleya hyalina TaxID=516124 RepID=A0A401YVI3_9ACTN|nr:serine hydrolase domain-containing protein [Embleya hyalina]GCD98600.1 serine hydrolase [Embleya hyalina]
MAITEITLAPDFTKAVRGVLEDTSWAAGLSLAITDRNGVLARTSIGFADLAAGSPVRDDTLFEIGSISKGFTAALILQARDSGLLDLDAPVTRYLPWFAVKSRFAPITVRHLLNHTAGIVGGAEYTGESAFEVWALRDTEATTPPGTWHYYSNTGYKALGLVLQAVHGRPYEQVLAEHLLAPLGMTGSHAAITHDTRRRLAVGYGPFYDDRAPRRADGLAPAHWLETATADGSIASTPSEMTAWIRLLLGNGSGPGDASVLRTESLHEMTTDCVEAEEPPYTYGLGMYVYRRAGREYVAHTGGMVGYNAALVCDRERGLGAVVLANGSGAWSDVAHFAIDWVDAALSGRPSPALVLPESAIEEAPREPSVIEEPPAKWQSVVGHYRGYNPWLSNIRVQCSGGRLWVWQGDFASDLGEPLVPLPDGGFRIGEDERSPERLVFDVVLDGKATRATLSGYPLYRTFTP